jgi:hypothetical protein
VNVRRLYTTQELVRWGYTFSAIRWAIKRGELVRITRSVYGEGSSPPCVLDAALAAVLATGGVASGTLAALLLELDGVMLRGPDFTVGLDRGHRRTGARRRVLAPERVTMVGGVRCADALQTLVDLAALVGDEIWEQALESALRWRLTSVAEVEAASNGPQRGAARMRRVLARRPAGARATESWLETRMVQLARAIPGLSPPARQLEILNAAGEFVARVDLAWPDLGLFVELDGQHHQHQPVYDSSRETAVVAATGWLCGRFTWDDVARHPRPTTRRLAELADQARRRPVAKSA